MADLQWDRSFALEQSGDDENMLSELLGLFRDSSASDLAKIQQAYQSNIPNDLAAAAHSIKGAAASLGIEGIRAVAHQLEKTGNAGNLQNVDEMIATLSGLLDEAAALK